MLYSSQLNIQSRWMTESRYRDVDTVNAGTESSWGARMEWRKTRPRTHRRISAKSMGNYSAPAHPRNSKQPWSAYRIEPCTQQHLWMPWAGDGWDMNTMMLLSSVSKLRYINLSMQLMSVLRWVRFQSCDCAIDVRIVSCIEWRRGTNGTVHGEIPYRIRFYLKASWYFRIRWVWTSIWR